MATPKQIAANQQNAQKSTGPKSLTGKAVAKMNAVKPSLLSRQIVIRGTCLHESNREYWKLCEQLWEDFTPVGRYEEVLVEKIATLLWRLRRVEAAESGEIRRNVQAGHWERKRYNPLKEAVELGLMGAFDGGDRAMKMEESVSGLYFLVHELMDARQAVERDGELTEATIQAALAAFGGKPNILTNMLVHWQTMKIETAAGTDAATVLAERRGQLLRAIDRQLQSYDLQLRQCTEREAAKEEALQAAALLPSADKLDKIMRYETTLYRQLERTRDQLERLQRRRLAKEVPPPANREVDHQL